MCGRFVRATPIEVLAGEFGVQEVAVEASPSWNVAPGREIPVVVQDTVRRLVPCRWGYTPSWAKEDPPSRRMINARAETLAAKPAFRGAFAHHRCLIPADGFFEWKKEGARRIPVYARLKSGRPLAFAGLFSARPSAEWGGPPLSGTIITTDANALLARVHDRMPVILKPDRFDLWLDPRTSDPAVLLPLLKPFPPGEMEMWRVDPRVNKPGNDDPRNIERAKA